MVTEHSIVTEVISIMMGVVSYGMAPPPSTGHEWFDEDGNELHIHYISMQLNVVGELL